METKKRFWQKKGFYYTLGVLFIISLFADHKPPETKTVEQPVAVQKATTQDSKPSEAEKQVAQKELDKIMDLGKQAGLVTSYEFSNTANVVYVGKAWYSQTVSFKKDFLAKVSSLKQTITGYHSFKVRDAYSDEIVAEVTAFSGSLEVYK